MNSLRYNIMYTVGYLRSYIQPWWSIKPDISQITENIFISDLATIYNEEILNEHGVTHIISLILGLKPLYPEKYTYLNIHVQDIPEENINIYFDQSIEFIENAIKGGGKVLVHCSCGVSRSSTIVINYLMHKNDWTLEESLKYVKSKRAIVEPNEGFKNQLVFKNR